MKAFFRLVLCAVLASMVCVSGQDKPVPTVKSIIEDFTKLRVEITEAKVSQQVVDEAWVLLEKKKIERLLLDVAHITSRFSQISKEEIQVLDNLGLNSLMDDFFLVQTRVDVSNALLNWKLSDFNATLDRCRVLLDQLIRDGLMFEYQPVQIKVTLFDLQVLSEVVKNNDFWVRVCKDDQACINAVPALSSDIATRLDQAKRWEEKAKNWSPGEKKETKNDPVKELKKSPQ